MSYGYFVTLESVLLTLAWLPRPGDLDMKWVVDFFNPVASLAFGTFGNKHVGVSPFPGFVWSQRFKCAAITLWLYKWCCRCSLVTKTGTCQNYRTLDIPPN